MICGLLAAHAGAQPPPHIVTILQDDLGYYDSGIHSQEAEAWTRNITSLANEGIKLMAHYTHWHCRCPEHAPPPLDARSPGPAAAPPAAPS